MTKSKWFLIILLLLVIAFLLGPRPSAPLYDNKLPNLPVPLPEVEKYIASKESAHKLRPDNQARIIWANDSAKTKTEYAIVYLHGFSASQGEGDPVHKTVAKDFH